MRSALPIRSFNRVAAAALALLFAGGAVAEELVLEEVVTTAQRRAENIQEVPVSVASLAGEQFDTLFDAGEDIRALGTRVPSLYAESSNGRLAPRFYIRGLGNTDFDLAASQPVSIIVDEVVQENVILKSFPLFDIERAEVLRGPQGTLFGRNTPAGIVKFDTRKPTREVEGFLSGSFAPGQASTSTVQGAVGGPLSDSFSTRVSFLYQDREDWIDNNVPASADFNGLAGSDALGGFNEFAYRVQGLYEMGDNLRILGNVHGRSYDGTASVFRANVIGPGTDGFNANFDRGSVTFDEGNNNPQEAEALGGSIKVELDLDDRTTLTSITAHEVVENKSLGDIDGGYGADFLSEVGPCPPGVLGTCIPFPSQTQDGLDNLDQFTQEIRVAQQATDQTFWQAGAYYFKSEFAVTTVPFFVPPTSVFHENDAIALFGHVSHDVNDVFTLTGGVRWTDDEKRADSRGEPVPSGPVEVSDSEISWDLSGLYTLNDQVNLYGRIARGFRAPTIQARDLAFFGAPSIARSETIQSYEGGFKADLAGNRLRLNGAVFYYTIDDQQLSAIGGGGNFVQLVNADKGTGFGVELDAEFLVNENLTLTAGFSTADTELDDSTLTVPPCGSGLCTVTDPLDSNGNAIVDGNPFAQAPEYIFTFTADFSRPWGNQGELFFFTDWAFQGETQLNVIYESLEFISDDTFEAGIRTGYRNLEHDWEVALYGRNITDEENVKGVIDFNNLTGFANEPQIFGISFRKGWSTR